MLPRRVWFAAFFAFLFHGLFILTARYRLSYDAYTHMLFANHYAENWFSLWETRWYAGFSVVSYPPLIHQLIALWIPLLGFDRAFALVLWIVASLYPFAIYAFSRIFTGKTSASYASLASALLVSVYVTAYIFGQLPFLAGTLLALFSAASLNRFLREGGLHNLFLTISLYATTAASHHAVLLIHPFLFFAVVSNVILQTPRTIQWQSFLLRFVLIGFLAVLVSILVVFPFWQWGMDQTMQTPIDHLSRHNFFESLLAFAVFFFPLYGPLLGVIPFLMRQWSARFIALLVSCILLFLLGLGGTTPLPRLFFGKAWEWLTYERFAFWASLILTVFFGILFTRMKLRFVTQPKPAARQRNLIPALAFSFFAITAFAVWLTPLFLPLQPKPIDMQPIVDFLNEADHAHYRYLTFGFGDQFAYLNLLTKATTLDGSYHTARQLPELRESGIGQIDTVYWATKGISAIEPILQASDEYGVRWGFVNPDVVEAIPLKWKEIHRSPFVPVLEKQGWIKLKTLENGVLVYENPNAVPPKPSTPPRTKPITSFAWGVFPMLSLITTLSLGTLRLAPLRGERILRGAHAFLVGLIPLSLCFWYYRVIAEFPHGRVYFTYTHALFFLTDALVLIAVILWLSVKITQFSSFFSFSSFLVPSFLASLRSKVEKFPSHPSSFLFPLLFLFLLSSLSLLWSKEWRTSAYISFHFWLVFLFVLSLREWSEAWKPTLYGFCAALSLQLIAGFVGFALQSTDFLAPLELKWPGLLDPSVRGSVVVSLADGTRVLRAYGTLPHPNLLGGLVFVSLLGPVGLSLAGRRAAHPVLILFALGISLLILTFSRSAWLGMIVFLFILILKSKYLNRLHLHLLLIVAILSVTLTILPYRHLLQARTTNIVTISEQFSFVGRAWLTQEAIQIMREYPLTGVGIGSFIIELSRRAGVGYIVEPVHNIFLLAGTELGIGGLLLVLGLYLSITWSMSESRAPSAILTGAALAGLGIISLFDHYLWTLAPGRLMLGLLLGLWAGQSGEKSLVLGQNGSGGHRLEI